MHCLGCESGNQKPSTTFRMCISFGITVPSGAVALELGAWPDTGLSRLLWDSMEVYPCTT